MYFPNLPSAAVCPCAIMHNSRHSKFIPPPDHSSRSTPMRGFLSLLLLCVVSQFFFLDVFVTSSARGKPQKSNFCVPSPDMLEKYIARLFSSYLGQYFADLDTRDVDVSLFKGNVELRNVELTRGAIQTMGFPGFVKRGVVGLLHVSIPLTKMSTESVEVTVRDVVLVVVPLVGVPWNTQSERDENRKRKKRQLEILEALRDAKQSQHGREAKAANDAAGKRSLQQIVVQNIKVTMQNIYIRYEDAVTTREAPMCCAVSIASITLGATDGTFTAKFVSDSLPISYREIRVDGISLRMGTVASRESEQLAINLPTSLCAEDWKASVMALSEVTHISERHVLPPSTLTVQITMPMLETLESGSGFFVVANCTMQCSGIKLNEDQFCCLRRISHYLRFANVMEQGRPTRPSEPPQTAPTKWWRHAISLVILQIRDERSTRRFSWQKFVESRKLSIEYATLFFEQVQGVSQTRAARLTELEDVLTAERISQCRDAARRLLQQCIALSKATSPSLKTPAAINTLCTQLLREELGGALLFEDQLKDASATIRFSIPQAVVALRHGSSSSDLSSSSTDHTFALVEMKGILLEYYIQPEHYTLSVGVQSLRNLVVSSTTKANTAQPFFQFCEPRASSSIADRENAVNIAAKRMRAGASDNVGRGPLTIRVDVHHVLQLAVDQCALQELVQFVCSWDTATASAPSHQSSSGLAMDERAAKSVLQTVFVSRGQDDAAIVELRSSQLDLRLESIVLSLKSLSYNSRALSSETQQRLARWLSRSSNANDKWEEDFFMKSGTASIGTAEVLVDDAAGQRLGSISRIVLDVKTSRVVAFPQVPVLALAADAKSVVIESFPPETIREVVALIRRTIVFCRDLAGIAAGGGDDRQPQPSPGPGGRSSTSVHRSVRVTFTVPLVKLHYGFHQQQPQSGAAHVECSALSFSFANPLDDGSSLQLSGSLAQCWDQLPPAEGGSSTSHNTLHVTVEGSKSPSSSSSSLSVQPWVISIGVTEMRWTIDAATACLAEYCGALSAAVAADKPAAAASTIAVADQSSSTNLELQCTVESACISITDDDNGDTASPNSLLIPTVRLPDASPIVIRTCIVNDVRTVLDVSVPCVELLSGAVDSSPELVVRSFTTAQRAADHLNFGVEACELALGSVVVHVVEIISARDSALQRIVRALAPPPAQMHYTASLSLLQCRLPPVDTTTTAGPFALAIRSAKINFKTITKQLVCEVEKTAVSREDGDHRELAFVSCASTTLGVGFVEPQRDISVSVAVVDVNSITALQALTAEIKAFAARCVSRTIIDTVAPALRSAFVLHANIDVAKFVPSENAVHVFSVPITARSITSTNKFGGDESAEVHWLVSASTADVWCAQQESEPPVLHGLSFTAKQQMSDNAVVVDVLPVIVETTLQKYQSYALLASSMIAPKGDGHGNAHDSSCQQHQDPEEGIQSTNANDEGDIAMNDNTDEHQIQNNDDAPQQRPQEEKQLVSAAECADNTSVDEKSAADGADGNALNSTEELRRARIAAKESATRCILSLAFETQFEEVEVRCAIASVEDALRKKIAKKMSLALGRCADAASTGGRVNPSGGHGQTEKVDQQGSIVVGEESSSTAPVDVVRPFTVHCESCSWFITEAEEISQLNLVLGGLTLQRTRQCTMAATLQTLFVSHSVKKCVLLSVAQPVTCTLASAELVLEAPKCSIEIDPAAFPAALRAVLRPFVSITQRRTPNVRRILRDFFPTEQMTLVAPYDALHFVAMNDGSAKDDDANRSVIVVDLGMKTLRVVQSDPTLPLVVFLVDARLTVRFRNGCISVTRASPTDGSSSVSTSDVLLTLTACGEGSVVTCEPSCAVKLTASTRAAQQARSKMRKDVGSSVSTGRKIQSATAKISLCIIAPIEKRRVCLEAELGCIVTPSRQRFALRNASLSTDWDSGQALVVPPFNFDVSVTPQETHRNQQIDISCGGLQCFLRSNDVQRMESLASVLHRSFQPLPEMFSSSTLTDRWMRNAAVLRRETAKMTGHIAVKFNDIECVLIDDRYDGFEAPVMRAHAEKLSGTVDLTYATQKADMSALLSVSHYELSEKRWCTALNPVLCRMALNIGEKTSVEAVVSTVQVIVGPRLHDSVTRAVGVVTSGITGQGTSNAASSSTASEIVNCTTEALHLEVVSCAAADDGESNSNGSDNADVVRAMHLRPEQSVVLELTKLARPALRIRRGEKSCGDRSPAVAIPLYGTPAVITGALQPFYVSRVSRRDPTRCADAIEVYPTVCTRNLSHIELTLRRGADKVLLPPGGSSLIPLPNTMTSALAEMPWIIASASVSSSAVQLSKNLLARESNGTTEVVSVKEKDSQFPVQLRVTPSMASWGGALITIEPVYAFVNSTGTTLRLRVVQKLSTPDPRGGASSQVTNALELSRFQLSHGETSAVRRLNSKTAPFQVFIWVQQMDGSMLGDEDNDVWIVPTCETGTTQILRLRDTDTGTSYYLHLLLESASCTFTSSMWIWNYTEFALLISRPTFAGNRLLAGEDERRGIRPANGVPFVVGSKSQEEAEELTVKLGFEARWSHEFVAAIGSSGIIACAVAGKVLPRCANYAVIVSTQPNAPPILRITPRWIIVNRTESPLTIRLGPVEQEQQQQYPRTFVGTEAELAPGGSITCCEGVPCGNGVSVRHCRDDGGEPREGAALIPEWSSVAMIDGVGRRTLNLWSCDPSNASQGVVTMAVDVAVNMGHGTCIVTLQRAAVADVTLDNRWSSPLCVRQRGSPRGFLLPSSCLVKFWWEDPKGPLTVQAAGPGCTAEIDFGSAIASVQLSCSRDDHPSTNDDEVPSAPAAADESSSIEMTAVVIRPRDGPTLVVFADPQEGAMLERSRLPPRQTSFSLCCRSLEVFALLTRGPLLAMQMRDACTKSSVDDRNFTLEGGWSSMQADNCIREPSAVAISSSSPARAAVSGSFPDSGIVDVRDVTIHLPPLVIALDDTFIATIMSTMMMRRDRDEAEASSSRRAHPELISPRDFVAYVLQSAAGQPPAAVTMGRTVRAEQLGINVMSVEVTVHRHPWRCDPLKDYIGVWALLIPELKKVPFEWPPFKMHNSEGSVETLVQQTVAHYREHTFKQWRKFTSLRSASDARPQQDSTKTATVRPILWPDCSS